MTWNVSATGASIGASLDVGGAQRIAGLVTAGEQSGTASTLRFRYEVVAGDSDTDARGVAASNRAVVVLAGGATLVDSEGAAASLSHAGLGSQAGHLVDGSRNAPANTAPACTGSADPNGRR